MSKNVIWLFRTNLKHLEYYHSYKDLETFEKECHDFYLLMLIWFLRNDKFDEAIVWRLHDKEKDDITFEVNGKLFIQKFVKNFDEVFKYEKPNVTIFRGGFPEYDELTKSNNKFFGLKLYIGAGRRVVSKDGGIYDKYLMEDEKDLLMYKNTVPFYKTSNQNIFYPKNLDKKYDICIVSNFKQLKMKGQDFFIKQMTKSNFLKGLKICHCGNEPERGKKLCKKNNIKNIDFLGQLDRHQLNNTLNISNYGIVLSNRMDGCPRVITEILCSGTPLLLRNQTRILDFYKRFGIVTFDDNEMLNIISSSMKHKSIQKNKNVLINNGLPQLSMDSICMKNLENW